MLSQSRPVTHQSRSSTNSTKSTSSGLEMH